MSSSLRCTCYLRYLVAIQRALPTLSGTGSGVLQRSMPVSSLTEKALTYGWWTADMQAELSVDNNETSARMVKARLEKTVLGQVTAHIKAVLQPAAGFISIRLDLEVIAKLQLSVTPHSVGTALLKQSKLKLKTDNIRCGIGSVVIGRLYKAHPVGCRHSFTFMPRLRPNPMREYRLL